MACERDDWFMRCVADVMVRDVQTVTTSEVVGPMRDLMVDLEIHGLPVLDDDGSVVGIVTSSDLVEDLPPELLATAVMSDEVVSVTPDTTLVEAARTMLDSRIHHLVVVDQGEVIGMASSFDLLRELAGDVEAHESSTIPGRPHAQPGDVIVIRGHAIGRKERKGTITEARGEDGGPPFIVQWHDDPHDEPHDVFFFPGTDADVVPKTEKG